MHSRLDLKTQRLIALARHIETNLHQQFRLDELARLACYSVFHFEKVFGELTGQTPFDYLRQRRMIQSCLRIRHEKLPIQHIAHQSGFNSDCVFSRNFRREFGFSPRDWRAGGWRDYHQAISRQWIKWHASIPEAPYVETDLTQDELNALDIPQQAQVRYMPPIPVWLDRSFATWGVRINQRRKLLASELNAEQPLCWCAITREDPGFLCGDAQMWDWAILSSAKPPAGWRKDFLPAGHYLCFRYYQPDSMFKWLYAEWLEKQHFWIVDARRPHLLLTLSTEANHCEELRIPVIRNG